MRGSCHQLNHATGMSLADGESLEGRQPHTAVCDGLLWARHWVLEISVPKTV